MINNRDEDQEYKRIKTSGLVSGNWIAYPVGRTSLVRAVVKIGWRKYRLSIQPDGRGRIITFTQPRRTVWWVRTG